MTHTGPFPDPSRPGVVYWDLKWTPLQSQTGDNILCGMAEDSSGYSSVQKRNYWITYQSISVLLTYVFCSVTTLFASRNG